MQLHSYFCTAVTDTLKKIIAFLLLAAFAVQSFNNTFIVFSFYVNQKKIAATLCENRYRPMLHCDGNCQLAKKIKQEESKNSQNPDRKLENKNEVFSFPPLINNCLVVKINDNTHYRQYSENEQQGSSPAVFHPPCA